MLPSVHLLALVGAAAAAEVTLTWAHDKGSGLSALVATKAGASKPVALSCSSILEGASSVDFSHLDADGGGNFTIGDQSYLVHSDPSFSGGPRCVTVYDDVISFDQCTDVEWDVDASAAAGPEAAVVDCFENETIKDKLRNLLEVFGDHEPSTGETSPAQIGHIDNSTLTALVEASGVDKRQCGLVYGTVLIGNGNPHQNWHHIQVSQNHHCAQQAGCTVGYSTTTSVGWSASSSISVWINGGFSVSQTWGESASYSCTGRPNDVVCAWYNAAHTAYTVQDMSFVSCTGQITWYGAPVVVSSPNNNNVGGEYYCMVGGCQYSGYNWWDRSARQPGGPRA